MAGHSIARSRVTPTGLVCMQATVLNIVRSGVLVAKEARSQHVGYVNYLANSHIFIINYETFLKLQGHLITFSVFEKNNNLIS